VGVMGAIVRKGGNRSRQERYEENEREEAFERIVFVGSGTVEKNE
jgi:hypothetical protein